MWREGALARDSASMSIKAASQSVVMASYVPHRGGSATRRVPRHVDAIESAVSSSAASAVASAPSLNTSSPTLMTAKSNPAAASGIPARSSAGSSRPLKSAGRTKPTRSPVPVNAV